MPQRRKSLVDLVRGGTFLARKDEHLLGRADQLPWKRLEELRLDYRAAADADGRRAVALTLERGLREHPPSFFLGDLQRELRRLGRPGSFAQLQRFFPWAFRHFAGPRAGQPFVLDPFQVAFLREFWRRRRDGRRVYQVGLLGIPKGNGKSPLAAGLGTFALVTETDAPEVYVIAGAKDQASICHDFARRNIELGPLAAWLDTGATIYCPEHLGEFAIQSSDGDLGHGVNPSAAVTDEWWLFRHRKHRESYNALAKALHKRPGRSWLLSITQAGYDLDSQLGETYSAAIEHPRLEVLRGGFLRVLRDEASGFLMHWYGLPEELADEADIEDPAVIRACNPAPWVDPADVISELRRPDTQELDVRRLRLNQWTCAKTSWISSGIWRGLRSDAQIPGGAAVTVGVDIGLVSDSSAVAWAHLLEDGRVLVRAKVWTAVDGQPGEFVPGGRVRLELVEAFVLELARRHQVRELVYDPRFFERSAQTLSDAGLVVVPLHQSSAPMADAYQGFYQACLDGRVCHDGDPVLARHVEAAAADLTERGWRVRKLRSSSRIDACVAAVMAHYRAAGPQQEERPAWRLLNVDEDGQAT